MYLLLYLCVCVCKYCLLQCWWKDILVGKLQLDLDLDFVSWICNWKRSRNCYRYLQFYYYFYFPFLFLLRFGWQFFDLDEFRTLFLFAKGRLLPRAISFNSSCQNYFQQHNKATLTITTTTN